MVVIPFVSSQSPARVLFRELPSRIVYSADMDSQRDLDWGIAMLQASRNVRAAAHAQGGDSGHPSHNAVSDSARFPHIVSQIISTINTLRSISLRMGKPRTAVFLVL